MSHRLKSVYHSGCFVPNEPCHIPEGSEVDLIIQGPPILPPEVTAPQVTKTRLEGRGGEHEVESAAGRGALSNARRSA